MLDEAGKMPGDLRIGRTIFGERRGDSLGRTEVVDLDHVRNDAAARRLPGEGRAEPGGQGEAAHCHEAPVAGLDAGGADALVPDLGCLLVGGDGLGRGAVSDAGSSEHQEDLSERLTTVPPPP